MSPFDFNLDPSHLTESPIGIPGRTPVESVSSSIIHFLADLSLTVSLILTCLSYERANQCDSLNPM